MLLVKFDKKLKVLRQKMLEISFPFLYPVLTRAKDGGILATSMSPVIVAFDKDMAITKQYVLGAVRGASIYKAAATPDGFQGVATHAIVGASYSPSDKYNQAFVVTYGSDYNVLNQAYVTDQNSSVFGAIASNDDGFVAVGGITNSSLSKTNGIIVSFGADLNVRKKVFINGELSLQNVVKITDGYVVSGYLLNTSPFSHIIMTLDENLNVTKKLLLAVSGSDVTPSLIVAPNGNYVFTTAYGPLMGAATGGIMIMLDKDLNIVKKVLLDQCFSSAAAIGPDCSYTSAGRTKVGAGSLDSYIATIRGEFETLPRSMAKYPSVLIDPMPSLQTSTSYGASINYSPTLGVAATNVFNLSVYDILVDIDPGLAVDANAVTAN